MISIKFNIENQIFTVDPKDAFHVEFSTRPNWFLINVLSAEGTGIYGATHRYPTPTNYDIFIPAAGLKLYTEMTGSDEFYLFNPSTEQIQIRIKAFTAPFDPLALAFSSLGLDVKVNLEGTDVNIAGFNSSLPTGTNTLGKVDLTADTIAQLTGSGSTDPQKVNITASIPLEIGTLPASLMDALQALTPPKYDLQSISITDSSDTVLAFNGSTPKHFHINFLANDGAGDMLMSIKTATAVQKVIIKAGETLDNLKGTALSLSFGPAVPGTLVSYRALGGVGV